MEKNSIMEQLAAPFTASEIEWRLQRNGEYNGVLKGFAVPYVDARAITNRLDEVFGIWGWQDNYAPWHIFQSKEGEVISQLCVISVYCEERGEWVSKWDGAENSDFEPVKGGLSDALKRAAVKWGIGRYLYQMDGVWVEAEKKGKNAVIKDSENARLDEIYNKAVTKIFGATATKQEMPAKPKPEAPGKAENTETEKPSQSSQPGFEEKTGNDRIITIATLKENNGASGTNTQLELIDVKSGKKVKAFLKGQHPELGQGMNLTNIKIAKKDGTYGPYNVLESYEIYAQAA